MMSIQFVYVQLEYQKSMSPKDIMVELLHILSKMMKARCEQSYDEAEADKWSVNHQLINDIINQIKNGGIK